MQEGVRAGREGVRRLKPTAPASLLFVILAQLVAAQEPPQVARPQSATPGSGADPFAVPPNPADTSGQPEGSSFSLYVDQDSVFPWLGPWGGDQNYTMGVGFGFTGRWIHSAHLDWPLKTLDGFSGLARLHQRLKANAGQDFIESHSLLFAVGAFTPRHLEVSEPIFDDRPYSSVLSVTTGRSTIDPYGRRVFRTELTVGLLGLRIAESVQTAIHKRRRADNQKRDAAKLTPYDPQGWPHQIDDGGALTAKYTATYLKAVRETKYHDVGVQAEGSLGYYTNVAVGPVVRVGMLRSDIWALNTNPLTASNQAICETQGQRDRSPRKLELYAWGAGRLRLVGYNALLQGWPGNDSDVTIGPTHIEPLIREVEGGVTASYRKAVVTIAIAHRSAEYDVATPRGHTWGGAYLTWRWNQPKAKAGLPPRCPGS